MGCDILSILMKKYILLLIVLLSFASSVYADAPATTGIIPGQIWYSKDPLVEGDKVLIYTALWNGNTSSLLAIVEFYDKNVVLGTREVTILPNTLADVSVSWQVTSGDHTISAKITSSSLVNAGKKQSVTLERTLTEEDKTFVPVSITRASITETAKDTVNKALTSVGSLVPPKIVESVDTNFNSVDSVRNSVATNIDASIKDTKEKIILLSKQAPVPTSHNTKTVKASESKPLDATEKPIAYIKLFLLSIASFIFGYKIVFYGLIAFIVFLLLRFIYRKIRNS